MRLRYKILWFEDDSTYIASLRPLVESHLDELGFIPELDIKATGRGLKKALEKDIDLILVDYNLKNKRKGDVILGRIKDNTVYTEVLFYSEDRNFMKKIVEKIKFSEGVFFKKGRRDLLDKIKRIIDLTLKKNQDIVNLRGLVIAETVDLVTQMEGIIVRYVGVKKSKIEFFSDKIVEQEFFSDMEKYKLVKRILDNEIFTIQKNPSMTSKLTALKALKKEFKKVNGEVIEVRNWLAHSKVSEQKENTLVCRCEGVKKPIEFNDTKCKEIRKNLRKHMENLDKIKEQLARS